MLQIKTVSAIRDSGQIPHRQQHPDYSSTVFRILGAAVCSTLKWNELRTVALCVAFAAAISAQTPTQYAPPAPYTPLTSQQRWQHYGHQTFLSPALYFASLAAAGIAQIDNDPPEWKQGVEGYSRRAGSLFATFAIQATVHEAFSAALHYDPRYLRCECTGGRRRIGHAIVWSFLTKNDAGQTRFNFPIIAGAYAGGMIPILWYPDRYSPLKDGFRDGSQQLGFSVGVSLIKEFSPELWRIVRHKSNP